MFTKRPTDNQNPIVIEISEDCDIYLTCLILMFKTEAIDQIIVVDGGYHAMKILPEG